MSLPATTLDSPPAPSSEPLRPLSAMEHGIWKTDLGAPLNFTTVMRLQGPVSEAALRAALPVLRARHTHLRTRIVAEGSGAVFRTDDVPPLPLRVVPGREGRWLEELEREINHPFPEPGPLGRFTLLEGEPGTTWLLATLHHSVADGMSGVFLLRDLVRCLAQLAAGEAPRLPPLEAPGPVDAL
ncbi:MAG TPA: condensation domain-containing protein, partial [Myxococcaceae bacterium]|nr:condensation domain-containing protein [Myxococcaceae bacterium]